MHFYPHNISEFNNSTRHLTRVERSVYRDAIELYYDTESVLTTDFEKLSKRLLCRSEEEKSALKSILEEFFELNDDGYFHERCNKEIEKYRANTSAKAKAGIASAEARRKKAADRKQKSTGVERMLNSVEQNNKQEPINNKQETIKKSGRFTPPTANEVFDYMIERNQQHSSAAVESEKFVDHYASNGWKVGGKAAMKDWRASVRNWLKNTTGAKPPPQSKPDAMTRLVDRSWSEGVL